MYCMGKFDLFNKFNSAVLVIDSSKKAVYRNNVFKRLFPDFENLDKFSHKLNYSVCALISNDVEVHSPILQALKAGEDFSAHVLYQSSGNDYSYYDLNATKKGEYSIIVFTDVTAKVGLEKSLQRNQALQKKMMQSGGIGAFSRTCRTSRTGRTGQTGRTCQTGRTGRILFD